HVISAVVIPSARNQTICSINSHFIQKEIKRVLFNFAVINKTYRFAYFSISNATPYFLHQAFTHITTNVKLGISGYFYHMSRNTLIIKKTKDTIEIMPDYII